MQHDVCPNPSRLSRASFPFITVVEADWIESVERLCAPLYRVVAGQAGPAVREMPSVWLDGRPFRLLLKQMRPFPTHSLRRPVGSVAAYRDDIVRALDWLFTGI